MSYEERLNIPLQGNAATDFETLGGVRLASGYVRVVIGARGPYVEFEQEQLLGDLSRIEAPHRYFWEWRTKDGVMVYEQRERVDYADYVPGRFYVSPFKLVVVTRVRCCEELRRLSKSAEAQQENLFDMGAP